MTFLRNLSGLWLLARSGAGISAVFQRHQIKWERGLLGISASFAWLPVLRWGCIFVGISAGYSRPPVVRWGRGSYGISAQVQWPPVEWLGRVMTIWHCCDS